MLVQNPWNLPRARASVASGMPSGARLYTARRYGNHIGVPCVCPRCDERPPKEIKPWNRWRWMTFHEMTAHKKG
jgi:hypothetical protein